VSGVFTRFSEMSFKNRVLIITFLTLIGGAVLVGFLLKIAVFPKLQGDESLIQDLKLIHFVAAAGILGLSWFFIERLSKRITSPLLELTETADRISREAGRSLRGGSNGVAEDPGASPTSGDEVRRLTDSFNRMIAYLQTSERRLRESEMNYRTLFDQAPFPLFVLDETTSKILDVNSGAQRQYGMTREEFLGRRFSELGAPDEEDPAYREATRRLGDRFDAMRVFVHKRADGSTFMAHIETRPLSGPLRTAMIAAVWDVTKKLEQDMMLAHAGKMATLGEMATGIAHELNQPLQVIKLASDILRKNVRKGRTPTSEELVVTAEKLSAQVERAAQIISHLRNFGRKGVTLHTRVDVNDAIRGVFTMLGTQLRKSGVECRLELAEGLPEIRGDEMRLEEVFLNLTLNARDAMLYKGADPAIARAPGRPKILEIRSFLEDDRVTVTVADTGPGVPPHLRNRIFEPFFTTKAVGEGTGLGLAISYGIVKEHQGDICVEAREGGGALFRVSFPAFGDSQGAGHDENPGG
jgi:PAS domain S-box-containing protein